MDDVAACATFFSNELELHGEDVQRCLRRMVPTTKSEICVQAPAAARC